MKVLLFGSTGMVGQGVLRECLADEDVTEVRRRICDTRRIARAMLDIAKRGYPAKVLGNPDINTAAGT
jgi:dTDP-4-dehydrorhamnose reductase